MIKYGLILSLLFFPLFMTGCTGYHQDIDQLAIVSAMGVDKAANGQYRVSFQVINSSQIASTKTGGGGGKSVPVVVYTDTGKTLIEAIRKASQQVTKRLYFSHQQGVIIEEKVARAGLKDVFDILERNIQQRLQLNVLIARRGTAEDILKVLIPTEMLPGSRVGEALKTSSRVLGETLESNVRDVVHGLTDDGIEPAISGIELIGKDEQGQSMSNLQESRPVAYTRINGIALFRDGKLQKWMEGNTARGAVTLLDRLKNTVVNINCGDKKDALAIEITHARTKLGADMNKGKPVLTVQMAFLGNVYEADCPIQLNDQETIDRLQHRLEREMKREVLSAVKTAQKEKCDIFGFGETLHRSQPQRWKTIRNRWNPIFSKAEVRVRAKAIIDHAGLRFDPFWSSK
ncbi:spore germination protein KC [Marinithermofilum abyssi]|uniref:Spore germination protein KC n=1 Tax=Marinithermofilum abyssi TaxID=1571185 RepID=A0A8J2VKX0_9BACL|nr:Ger(x)C family spore germination protein [Marinithermofilum abyssi]GGE29168.1 spore germination protein KC [Marinithermofilum abyssi]